MSLFFLKMIWIFTGALCSIIFAFLPLCLFHCFFLAAYLWSVLGQEMMNHDALVLFVFSLFTGYSIHRILPVIFIGSDDEFSFFLKTHSRVLINREISCWSFIVLSGLAGLGIMSLVFSDIALIILEIIKPQIRWISQLAYGYCIVSEFQSMGGTKNKLFYFLIFIFLSGFYGISGIFVFRNPVIKFKDLNLIFLGLFAMPGIFAHYILKFEGDKKYICNGAFRGIFVSCFMLLVFFLRSDDFYFFEIPDAALPGDDLLAMSAILMTSIFSLYSIKFLFKVWHLLLQKAGETKIRAFLVLLIFLFSLWNSGIKGPGLLLFSTALGFVPRLFQVPEICVFGFFITPFIFYPQANIHNFLNLLAQGFQF